MLFQQNVIIYFSISLATLASVILHAVNAVRERIAYSVRTQGIGVVKAGNVCDYLSQTKMTVAKIFINISSGECSPICFFTNECCFVSRNRCCQAYTLA